MTVVTEHLERAGLRFEVLPHARSTTALEEAAALHLGADEVLKSIALIIETGPALAIVPASRRLDMELVRVALGDRHARLATEDEIERTFPEFELGALPALPALLHVPVVIDPAVFERRQVTFAAGLQRESVRVEADPVLRQGGASVTVAPITAPGETSEDAG
jgi:Ala-tRNA(Pro) deacylase